MKKYLIFHSIICLLLISCNSQQNPTPGEVVDIKDNSNEEIQSPKSFPTIADTTSSLLLDALFGNYNDVADNANVDESNIDISELEERAFEWKDEKLIANLEETLDLADGRSVFIISVKPEEGYECRICAPLLGAGVLKGKGGKWYIGDFHYFDVSGSYGSAPGFKTQKISNNDFALITENGDLHMGYLWSGESLFSINNKFKSILDVNTYNDNSGTCNVDNEKDSPFNPCYENETTIEYVANSNIDYYEIHTHQTGNEWDPEKEELIDIDKKEIFVFSNGKYELKK